MRRKKSINEYCRFLSELMNTTAFFQNNSWPERLFAANDMTIIVASSMVGVPK
jgi:hypothetical protein